MKCKKTFKIFDMEQLKWIFALLQLMALTVYREVCSQDVVSCTQVTNSRTCNTGLVSQRDVITIACTLDKSAVGKPNTAAFSVSPGNDNFVMVCTSVPLDLCVNSPNLNCDCVDNVDNYTVYLNRTAEPSFDGAKVRLTWGTDMDTIQIEAVRDPALEECTLNGKNIPHNSNSNDCSFEIKKGDIVSYSCNSALSPVETSIFFESINNIGASFVVIDGSQSGEGVYTFSSKICGIPAHSGSCNATVEKDGPDNDCDTTCIIIIVVGVVACGTVVAVGVIYYWKKHGKITTCVIIVEVSATLIQVETLVIQEVERKGEKLPDCEKVIKYKGKKQDDKNIKLKDLILEHVGVTVKVTVNVCRDGTFVLDEIVSADGDKEMDEPQTDPNFKAPPPVFYSKPSKHKDKEHSGEYQMKVDIYEREQDADA